jgi:putative ATP-binding cassette transporter
MSAFRVPITRSTWVRFVDMLKALGRSRVGGKARGLFLLLILFLFGINDLNVLNSYVGRNFMTAIERWTARGSAATA